MTPETGFLVVGMVLGFVMGLGSMEGILQGFGLDHIMGLGLGILGFALFLWGTLLPSCKDNVSHEDE